MNFDILCLHPGKLEDGTEYIQAADGMGFIPEETEFKRIAVLWNRFYLYVMPDGIKKHNDDLLEEYMGPSPKPEQPPPNPKPRDTSGYVYILKGCDYFKIGKSVNVIDRVESFSPLLPFEVEILHTIRSNDYAWAEKTLHERFAEKRSNGEWFRLEPLDIAWLLNTKEMNHDE